MNRRERAEERGTLARMAKLHAEIDAIPDGPCETYQERLDRETREALELVPWDVFLKAGARPRPRD